MYSDIYIYIYIVRLLISVIWWRDIYNIVYGMLLRRDETWYDFLIENKAYLNGQPDDEIVHNLFC